MRQQPFSHLNVYLFPVIMNKPVVFTLPSFNLMQRKPKHFAPSKRIDEYPLFIDEKRLSIRVKNYRIFAEKNKPKIGGVPVSNKFACKLSLRYLCISNIISG